MAGHQLDTQLGIGDPELRGHPLGDRSGDGVVQHLSGLGLDRRRPPQRQERLEDAAFVPVLEEAAHQSLTDLVLLGEAAVAASGWLLLWFAIFFACLATFIRFWEEPHLVQRYGSEYVNYRENVPAWMPRILARTPSA